MARVATDLKRLFVRSLADSVEDGDAADLAKALKALRRGQFQLIGSGEICIMRSGDGFSGSFAIPNAAQNGGLTPSSIAELASELTDLYEKALTFLTKVAKYDLDADTVDLSGWPSPLPVVADADPDIAQADVAIRMLHYLVPKTESRGDYSMLGVQGAWQQ